MFVSGKRIFRAKLAFNSTSGIVEFTLRIDQGTKTIIHATTIKEEHIHEMVNIVLVRKAQKKQFLQQIKLTGMQGKQEP